MVSAIYLSRMIAFVFSLLLTSTLAADDVNNQLPAAVQKILEQRCLACHNDLDRKGDFSLQSGKAIRDSGYIVGGNADDSHFISVLEPQSGSPAAMPKDGAPLLNDEVTVLRNWINRGSPWPNDFLLSEPVVDTFDWWSLQPIKRPDIPNNKETGWIRNPIDAFVLQKQLSLDLQHAEVADRRTLIRRITYDLTGLPPTAEDVAVFVADEKPLAYERLVDRLLDSPQYGEHWARHWLDVVKYADTCGFDKDKLRPNAWPYRDYVIRSFNADKPYSRFVQEQIAGDVLFPGEPDGILGLGFVAAGPWDFIGHVEVSESKLDGMEARNLDRDEMVSNTLNTFCSATVQCARCHNHKFDPFTQEHYYSLQSVFAAVDRAERVYDLDPDIERQKQELAKQEQRLSEQLKSFNDDINQKGGPELAALNTSIAALLPTATLVQKQPEFGYHSQISANRDTAKWVEVDLGSDVKLSEIRLRPCHDDYGGIGSGFGFPVRFRIETRLTPEANSASTVVADFTEQDFDNPGLAPVILPCANIKARFIRVVALSLAERNNDFIMALAELEALDANGANVALNRPVTALDSIEAPERWSISNLTDGTWAVAANIEAAQNLADVRTQKTLIMKQILTPEKIAIENDLIAKQQETTGRLAALPQGKTVYAASTHFTPQGNFKPTEGVPRTVRTLHRGNIQQPQTEVQPGTIPLTSGDSWQFKLPADNSEADRRTALAQWITAPTNPLTWRSIANRIWLYHFGRGIVDSPNDLGRMGQTPSHPELLDWLADEFRRTQSFKHMHRLIANSATYRQQSTFDADNATIDSDNQFYWRLNRRKLSAEEVRDTILSVSGRLNLDMGGPGFYLFALEKTEHSPHYEYHKFDPRTTESHRRSIYRFIARSQPNPLMTSLDCADSSQSTPKRNETLTSLQALTLLNNKFTLVMAEYFAERLQPVPETERAAAAFELAIGRIPTSAELQNIQQYSDQHGLPNLCRILFNTSEFLFVD